MKGRIVHHNQLKRFYETMGLQEETALSKQTPRIPVVEDVNTAEDKNDVVIVVDQTLTTIRRRNCIKTKLNQ